MPGNSGDVDALYVVHAEVADVSGGTTALAHVPIVLASEIELHLWSGEGQVLCASAHKTMNALRHAC